MKTIAKRLRPKIVRNIRAFAPLRALCDVNNKQSLRDPWGLLRVDELVNTGHSVQHASFLEAQNAASYFAEVILDYSVLDELNNALADAEDIYMPGGPPMSPLTTSFFSMWSLFDCMSGLDRETTGTIMIDLADELGLSRSMTQRIEQIQASRMGVYEHVGEEDGMVLLKEIGTDDEFTCISPAGYLGAEGELWYVRLIPPMNDEFDAHLAVTTPYVLQNVTVSQWKKFYKRRGVTRKGLNRFLKFGAHANYWNNYVVDAYVNNQHNVIFLTGVPDVPASLPHGNEH